MDFTRKEKIIKVSFKQCPSSDKKLFSTSHCIMPIKVGERTHEGEKFFATMKLINASFKECTILVEDSIQRHTLKIQSDLDETVLYEQALQAGDSWLNRNATSYQYLSIPYKILRWDEWLAHSDYEEFHKKVKFHYENNSYYQKRIYESIEKFLIRYQNQPVKFSFQKAFSCYADYLMEECAVMCLWAKAGYAFEVYPSGRNNAMIATYKLIIQPAYPELLKSISLYFG